MEAAGLVQLQSSLQDAVRSLATAAGPVEELAPSVLQQLLPNAFGNGDQPSRVDGTTRAILQSVFKQASLDLAQEAQHRGQPPMQYTAGKAAEPSMHRLLAAALLCCKQELLEPHALMAIVEDLQDVCIAQHCLDIIGWLEQHVPALAPEMFVSGPAIQQFTRLCNTLLKRLGRHQVVSKARLLLLIASTTPLFDKSGVGISGVFAAPDGPTPEDVPEGAVDSTGNPVNVLLYKKFWDLQSMLQDPLSVLASLDKWSIFKKELSAVLDELAKSPATVAATRTAAADGAGQSADIADEGAGTQCYLSSWKLFGLQLTDSSFRRDFLVQVLVMLRTLLIPGKVPADTLKQKQRMEALQLEEEVYKVLDATPRDGQRFSRAVREVLQREVTWVMWKKGGKDFVVPGKEADAGASLGPTAAAAAKKLPVSTSCIDWTKPPVPPLVEAVAKARQDAAKAQEQQASRVTEGLQKLRELNTMGRMYDTMGEPPEEKPEFKRRKAARMLGDNSSSLTFWAQRKVAAGSQGEQPLLAGLKKADQPDYPTSQALCSQVLREMDPDSGIDREYKRIVEDGVYRWRIGRVVAQRHPEQQNVELPEKLEAAMVHLFPQQVSEKYLEQAKAEQERQGGQKQQPGRPGAAGRGPAAAAAAAARRTPEPGLSSVAAGDETAAAAGSAAAASASGGGSMKQEEPAAAAAAEQADTAAAGVKSDPGAGEGNAAEAAAGGAATPETTAGDAVLAGMADDDAMLAEGTDPGPEAELAGAMDVDQ